MLNENGIVQVLCECDDMTVIYKHTNKLGLFEIPQNCKKIKAYNKSEKEFEFTVDFIKKMEANEPVEAEKSLKENFRNCRKEINYKFTTNIPTMAYFDVTDAEMFGFKEISKNVIDSRENGLWAWHGIRKFKFVFQSLTYDDDKWTKTASLFFNKRDNDEINISMSPITIAAEQDDDDGRYILYGYIDTNKLGDCLQEGRQRQHFIGRIEFTFGCNASEGNEIVYSFPVELWLNNTNQAICEKMPVLCKDLVSIDFGTSSTCVAVKRNELMTLATPDESEGNIDEYENPTYIMIYRWEEIYQQWQQKNRAFPIFLKGNRKEEKLGDKEVQIDFGYSVKDTLRDVDDKALNAIISEIKMIPRTLYNGEQMSLIPYIADNNRIHLINLVDKVEEQDEENLDVVALYGYILGRAINRVEKKRIYTKFQITYPVKFNKTVRDRMCASLKYGLMRSIPIPLREAKNKNGQPVFQIDAQYPEPVAYIGSVCGKYLKVTNDNPYKLFAIYDFGGGTLDFAFGFLKKDNDDENSIYVLDVDGDENVGGETYIRHISYWIYTSIENINYFIKNRIPFEIPKDETLPDNFPSELFNNSAAAKSNVKKINEVISRYIFQNIPIGQKEDDFETPSLLTQEKQEQSIARPGRKSKSEQPEQVKLENVPDKQSAKNKAYDSGNVQSGENKLINTTENIKIDFLDEQNNPIQVELSIPRQKINDLLKDKIDKNVQQFKASLNQSFNANKKLLDEHNIIFDKETEKTVVIFKAGNSSKHVILSKLMQDVFPDNEVMLVDETNPNFMDKVGKKLENKIKAITPKTAVSLGQLMLSDYKLELLYESTPFNWYIYRVDGGAGELRVIINRVGGSKDWARYGRINAATMIIYYASARLTDPDDINLQSQTLDNIDEYSKSNDLYIRVKSEDIIEYCVCGKDKEPSDDQEIFECRLQ